MKSNILDALKWRYATKQFDTAKKVSEEDLHELIEVLRLAPSSFGLQPWKFVLVNDKKLREKLKGHAWGQAQITDASHLFVLCARTDVNEKLISEYMESIASTRGVAREKLKGFEDTLLGFRKGMTEEAVLIWSKNQVYIALGFLLKACALKGIDACPMEGFDRGMFDEVLGLKEQHLASAVLCPVGYRSETDHHAKEKKVRFGMDKIIVKK